MAGIVVSDVLLLGAGDSVVVLGQAHGLPQRLRPGGRVELQLQLAAGLFVSGVIMRVGGGGGGGGIAHCQKRKLSGSQTHTQWVMQT